MFDVRKLRFTWGSIETIFVGFMSVAGSQKQDAKHCGCSPSIFTPKHQCVWLSTKTKRKAKKQPDREAMRQSAFSRRLKMHQCIFLVQSSSPRCHLQWMCRILHPTIEERRRLRSPALIFRGSSGPRMGDPQACGSPLPPPAGGGSPQSSNNLFSACSRSRSVNIFLDWIIDLLIRPAILYDIQIVFMQFKR